MINENALMIGGTVASTAGVGILSDLNAKIKAANILKDAGQPFVIPKMAIPRKNLGIMLATLGLGTIGLGVVKRAYNPSTEALTEEAYRRGYERALNATSNPI